MKEPAFAAIIGMLVVARFTGAGNLVLLASPGAEVD